VHSRNANPQSGNRNADSLICPILWVTWHDHQRTRSLVQRLRCPVAVRDVGGAFSRHVLGVLWTLRTLRAARPRVMLLHFSYSLMLACLLYKRAARPGEVRIVCDCHNKALMKRISGVGDGPFQVVKSWLLRHADILVVSNDVVADYAKQFGVPVTVLRDPLPELDSGDSGEATAAQGLDSDVNIGAESAIVFVCSFDADEPLDAIFDAARLLADAPGPPVVITGNFRKAVIPESVRNNPRVFLPGFLPRSSYVSLIRRAAAIVVLTKDEDCLLCGAYEGVAARRPTVVSDTPVLRSCFGSAVHYVSNEGKQIAEQVKVAASGMSEGSCADALAAFEAGFEREWRSLVSLLAAFDCS
jgi:glycosyltransferase involved in cell wall biosynthesis